MLIGLCTNCSDKLNHHSKKREVKRIKKQTKHNHHRHNDAVASTSTSSCSTTDDSTTTENEMNSLKKNETIPNRGNEVAHQQLEQIFWSKSTDDVEKTREEEFDDYLANLLL